MRKPETTLDIKDLVDFYNRWPGLRENMNTLCANTEISADQEEILHWMVKMIDRIGPADLEL